MKSESRIQQEIVIHFNNTYPELRGCLCYNNNNSVGGYRGKVNKFLGIIDGRSDLVLYYQKVATHIELKTEDGTQSKNQIEWQAFIESQGFDYYIVRSLKEFLELIEKIIVT
jgi:hypothetical protein